MLPHQMIKPENDRHNLFLGIKGGQTVCAMAARYKVSCDTIKMIMDGQDGKESYQNWFRRTVLGR